MLEPSLHSGTYILTSLALARLTCFNYWVEYDKFYLMSIFYYFIQKIFFNLQQDWTYGMDELLQKG